MANLTIECGAALAPLIEEAKDEMRRGICAGANLLLELSPERIEMILELGKS